MTNYRAERRNCLRVDHCRGSITKTVVGTGVRSPSTRPRSEPDAPKETHEIAPQRTTNVHHLGRIGGA